MVLLRFMPPDGTMRAFVSEGRLARLFTVTAGKPAR